MLIKNAHIHTGVSPDPFCGDILIQGGKIKEIARSIDPADHDVLNLDGKDVYPGFIDVHTHIGMFGFSGDATQDDVEKFDRCVPNHRGIDCVNPEEPSFSEALQAGVTCVCVGPGSVSCIGGTHVVLKTYGHRIDDMIVKDPAAMKIAFGENPKKALQDRLTTRMTIAATIRDTLKKAKEYHTQLINAQGCPDRLPKFDPKLDALIPVIEKKIPLKAHVHQKADIYTAIRIAKECDVLLTLEHASDGGSIADELAQEGYPIAVGPYLAQSKKAEAANSNASNVVKMIDAGCQVSVMTDAPIIAEKYLPIAAGLLMREGLDEYRALQTITINAAKHLGVDDQLGSIEVGKDADLIISNGCPLQISVKPCMVIINGDVVYSTEAD